MLSLSGKTEYFVIMNMTCSQKSFAWNLHFALISNMILDKLIILIIKKGSL